MNSGQLLDYNRQSAITGGTYNSRYGDNPDPERDKALWLNPNNMSYMDKRLEKYISKMLMELILMILHN